MRLNRAVRESGNKQAYKKIYLQKSLGDKSMETIMYCLFNISSIYYNLPSSAYFKPDSKVLLISEHKQKKLKSILFY